MGYQKIRPSGYLSPDFILKVIQGRAGRYFAFTKFASNSAVGLSEEDIWGTGGVMQYLTTAETMDLVSSSANDTLGGTGARTVHIIGFNNDFNFIRENVNLNGLTPVTTITNFLRIFRLTVSSGGSLETNDGDITLTATTSGFNQGTAIAGDGKTLQSQFTTPKGFYGAVTGWAMSDLNNDQIRFRMRVREDGGVFVIRRQLEIFQSAFEDVFQVPFLIPPKTDIKITAFSTMAGGMNVTDASYGMILVDEREVQSVLDEDIA